jgi:hypothetical protein
MTMEVSPGRNVALTSAGAPAVDEARPVRAVSGVVQAGDELQAPLEGGRDLLTGAPATTPIRPYQGVIAAASFLGPRTPGVRRALEKIVDDLKAAFPTELSVQNLRQDLGLAPTEVLSDVCRTDVAASSDKALGDVSLLDPHERGNALAIDSDLYFRMDDASLRALLAANELDDRHLAAFLLKHPDTRHLDIYRRLAELEREAAVANDRWRVGSHLIPTGVARLAHESMDPHITDGKWGLGPERGFKTWDDVKRLAALVQCAGLPPSLFWIRDLQGQARRLSEIDLNDPPKYPFQNDERDKMIYLGTRANSLPSSQSLLEEGKASLRDIRAVCAELKSEKEPAPFNRLTHGRDSAAQEHILRGWNRAIELGEDPPGSVGEYYGSYRPTNKVNKANDEYWDELPDGIADELARLILNKGGLGAKEGEQVIGEAERKFVVGHGFKKRDESRKLKDHPPIQRALKRLTREAPALPVDQALARLAADSRDPASEKEAALRALLAGDKEQLKEGIRGAITLALKPGERFAPKDAEAMAIELMRKAADPDAAALLLALVLKLTPEELGNAVATRDFPPAVEAWGRVATNLAALSAEELAFALVPWSAGEHLAPTDEPRVRVGWASRAKLLRQLAEETQGAIERRTGRLAPVELKAWIARSELALKGSEQTDLEDTELKDAVLGLLRVHWETGLLPEAELDELFASPGGESLKKRAEGQVALAVQGYLDAEPRVRVEALHHLVEVLDQTSIVGRWDLAVAALLNVHQVLNPELPEVSASPEEAPPSDLEVPETVVATLRSHEPQVTSYRSPAEKAGTPEKRAAFIKGLAQDLDRVPWETDLAGLAPGALSEALVNLRQALGQAEESSQTAVSALADPQVRPAEIARWVSQAQGEAQNASGHLQSAERGTSFLDAARQRLPTGEEAAGAITPREEPPTENEAARIAGNRLSLAEELGRFQGALVAQDLLAELAPDAQLRALPSLLWEAEEALAQILTKPKASIHIPEKLGKAKQLLEIAVSIFEGVPDARISQLLDNVKVFVGGARGEGSVRESSDLGKVMSDLRLLGEVVAAAGHGRQEGSQEPAVAQARRIASKLRPTDGRAEAEEQAERLGAMVSFLFTGQASTVQAYDLVRRFSGARDQLRESLDLDRNGVVQDLLNNALTPRFRLRWPHILKALYLNEHARSARVPAGVALCDLVSLPRFQTALHDSEAREQELKAWEARLESITPGADQRASSVLWALATEIHKALEADEAVWGGSRRG